MSKLIAKSNTYLTLVLCTKSCTVLGVASEYHVETENSAVKVIQRLQRHDQVRVLRAILALRTEPRPVGCTKLSGTDSSYRVRVGHYRIVYTIDDSIGVVTITRVGHRGKVYRQ